MNNRINQLFVQKKKQILSVYFTAGFPELHNIQDTLQTMQQQGIDMVEIGIPFSDPIADGEVIQKAAMQALQNGMTVQLLLDQLKDIRKSVHIPLILMGYLNPIMQYGFHNFCKACNQCGIDGLIIPDLPFYDYQQEYQSIANKFGLHIIMLITPETSEERIRMIDTHTKGFIYMVSAAAITGTKDTFGEDTLRYFQRIANMQLNNPCLIGFGISNKATFDTVCQYASGAIIGSKYVQLISQYKNPDSAISKLLEAIGKT